MELVKKTVLVYRTPNGYHPFIIWKENEIDLLTQARIEKRIDLLKLGHFGKNRYLGDGVWELKIDLGPGYRIYYGEISKILILLLLGGSKKTQQKDIVKAKYFWREYNE